MPDMPAPFAPTPASAPQDPPAASPMLALIMGERSRAYSRVADGPLLTSAAESLLRDLDVFDQHHEHRRIQIPVERCLSVVFDTRTIGKLWTLGPQPEWLVLGYLRNRQLFNHVNEVESVTVEWDCETATVFTRRTYPTDLRVVLASCHADGRLFSNRGRLTGSTLNDILEASRSNDALYRKAGCVQGCSLFRHSELLLSVEDVSRRNCFDIITGWITLHGVTGEELVLCTTGRLTAEVVLKAANNGIATLVSGKGITGSCVDMATRLGMTLIGHAAPGRYLCYAGSEFIDTTN